MGKSISLLGCCILLLCSTTFLSGCSLGGYFIGKEADTGRPGAPVSIPDCQKGLPYGMDLFVVKNDSSIVKGPFVRVAQVPVDALPASKYEEKFEEWRVQAKDDCCRLPALGTTLQVRMRIAAGMYSGRFAGLEPAALRIVTLPRGQVLGLRLDDVQEICDSLGHTIATRDVLREALVAGAPTCVQLVPGVQLSGKPGIPLEEIAYMNVSEPGSGRWVGLAVGMALDAAAIIAISSIDFGLQFKNGFGGPGTKF
jgi:hypothetical protein